MVAIAAASLGPIVGTASSAEAGSYKNVQVKVGDWWCGAGGKVASTNITMVPGVDPNSWGQNGRYSGWIEAPLNRRVTVAGAVLCDRPWYRGPDYWVEVAGTRWFTREWQIKWL